MGRSKRKDGSDDHDAQSKITKQKYAAHDQAAWTIDPKFTTWIRPVTVVEDRMRAFCGLCRTDFIVAASGIYNVRAHAKERLQRGAP